MLNVSLLKALKSVVGESALPLVSLSFNGYQFETGKAVTFPATRNTEKSPKAGSQDTYQQNIEPAGRYMIFDEFPDNKLPGWVKGDVSFGNPLVLDWGSGYDDSSWKMALSTHYGKKGKALTRALKADGYDGIITVNNNKDISEIVEL